ncbi:hypothetical protein E4663_02385 [Halobacillus salinus]|uniref:Uncharacterized protein n=1 Tax=Halobacillus salinus TaxID=192814 RepID=A0A4Z0H3U3_9BACI|nr:hypothetical protein E4663_02385 [Halobacillus salinus]
MKFVEKESNGQITSASQGWWKPDSQSVCEPDFGEAFSERLVGKGRGCFPVINVEWLTSAIRVVPRVDLVSF